MSATHAINNALIVTAHPVDNSLSHSLAARIAGKLREQGTQVEMADLHGEGFNPAMSRADLDLYHGDPSALPDAILREQQPGRAGGYAGIRFPGVLVVRSRPVERLV
jgi:NAD(P)H dehydrogenase (quinone)